MQYVGIINTNDAFTKITSYNGITYIKLLKNIKYIIPESTSECPYKDTREELANNICLSSNDCNVCKRTNGVHEGCNHPFSTLNPVCDLDKNNTGIDDAATRKVAVCVGCKKNGNNGHF